MLYKLSKGSRIYGLLTLLLIFSTAAIPTSVNAQERACVISDSGKKVCGKLVRDNGENQLSTPSQSIATVKFENMVVNVQLLKCSRKTSTVSCKFLATVVDPDLGYGMFFYSGDGTNISQVTDSKGEDYIADKVILGKSESKKVLYTIMVKDQPVSVTVLFKIPTEVNTIKTLSFLTGNGTSQKAAIFANINISR
jgi:hypothetical protein